MGNLIPDRRSKRNNVDLGPVSTLAKNKPSSSLDTPKLYMKCSIFDAMSTSNSDKKDSLIADQLLRLQAARDYAALITAQFNRRLSSTASSITNKSENHSVVTNFFNPELITLNAVHEPAQKPVSTRITVAAKVDNNNDIGNPDLEPQHRPHDLKPHIQSPASTAARSRHSDHSLSPRHRHYSRSISPCRGRYRSSRRLSPSPRRYSRSPLGDHRSRRYSRSPPLNRARYCSRSPRRSRSPFPSRRRSSPYSRSPPPPRNRHLPVDRKPAALVTPVINRTINRIYVGNIAPTLSEQAVRAAFSRFGYIKELSMTRDTDLNTHKGWCFIEFDAPEAAMASIQLMNGVDLDGRTLKVNHTNAYNDAIWRHFPIKVPSRLYYANVHPLLTESEMQDLFRPFGKMPDVLVFRHKGYGFVEYETETEMNTAVKCLNRLQYENAPDELLMVTPTLVGGPFPEGMSALSRFPRPRIPPPALLPGPKPILPHVRPEAPSAILLLKNMVAPGDVDDYLKGDVEEECGKYGNTSEVLIHVNSDLANGNNESGVRVFVVFESISDRLSAEKVMNGRFFGGRVVSAIEFPLSKFEAKDYDN